MIITDLNAHVGHWSHRPIGVDAAGLAALLAPFGVSTIYAGRFEALWFENPHDANRLPFATRAGDVNVVAVQVLDPTVITWAEELDRLAKLGPLPMVRLLPSYHGYTLADADPLLAALAKRNIAAQVVVRFEDVRRQHRRAQVPDVPPNSIRDAAARHPELRVLLSGGEAGPLQSIASRLPESNNLWVDTANADGLGTLPELMKSPLRSRVVFGSHAPLFIPYSAFARVVLDLDDEAVKLVLEENAKSLLKGS